MRQFFELVPGVGAGVDPPRGRRFRNRLRSVSTLRTPTGGRTPRPVPLFRRSALAHGPPPPPLDLTLPLPGLPATVETYLATDSIWLLDRLDPNAGIPPPPLVTWWTTR